MEVGSGRVYEFGPFRLEPAERRLLREGAPIVLTPKVLDLLIALVERSGHLVSKDELLRKVWPDSFVEEANLSVNIAVLRRAIGDGPQSSRKYIETIPRVGYRFIAPVREVAGEAGEPAIHSIAVLPLSNLSADPTQDYFADGMTEEFITELAKISRLRVISRTSAMHFKGTRKTLPEIARELGVEAVVEGAVARDGNRVRISAQLIDARTDLHLWARSYEGNVSDVLRLQERVALAIANEIRVKLTPLQQARLGNARSLSPEAHELYLRGRFHWNKRTEEGLKKSIHYFQQSIEGTPHTLWRTLVSLTPTTCLVCGVSFHIQRWRPKRKLPRRKHCKSTISLRRPTRRLAGPSLPSIGTGRGQRENSSSPSNSIPAMSLPIDGFVIACNSRTDWMKLQRRSESPRTWIHFLSLTTQCSAKTSIFSTIMTRR